MSLETLFVKNLVQMVVSQPLRPPPRMAPVEMVLLKQRIQIIVHKHYQLLHSMHSRKSLKSLSICDKAVISIANWYQKWVLIYRRSGHPLHKHFRAFITQQNIF